MDEFGYYKHGDLSPEAIAAMRRAQNAATREINDFTVSFVLDQRPAGSGTLVKVGANFYILTALHVSNLIEKNGKPVGLVISDRDHQFFLDQGSIDFIPVGTPSDTDRPELGPDLAAIRLLDPARLGTIKSKKSFYRLDGRSFESWSDKPIDQMPWWIAGAPAELAVSLGAIDTSQHVLAATHFHAEATFKEFARRGEFDFVNLRVIAGAHSFPSHYGGVSGGGIWLAPLEMNPDLGPESISHVAPILSGVAFYQSALEDEERTIIGHGPHSIYSKVVAAVAA